MQSRVLAIGAPPDECEYAKDALKIMERVVELAIAMLDVCFDDTALEGAIECMHVRSWWLINQEKQSSYTKTREDAQEREDRLMRLHKSLCEQKGWLERPVSFLALTAAAAKEFDNLEPGQRVRTESGRCCLSEAARKMLHKRDKLICVNEKKKVSFSVGFKRSTTTNERFLKKVATQWKRRGTKSSLQGILHACALSAFGPQSFEEMAELKGGTVVPKEFLLEADSIWDELNGRRAFVVRELKRAARPKRLATKKAWDLRHRTMMRTLLSNGRRKGRGNQCASLIGGAKLLRVRPDVIGVDGWTAAQKQLVARYARSKKRRDEDCKTRAKGTRNPYEKDAVALEKALKKNGEARNGRRKMMKRQLDAERKVYLSDRFKKTYPEFKVPSPYESVKGSLGADIIVTDAMVSVTQPIKRYCDVTRKWVHVLSSEVAIAIIAGKRLCDKAFFDSCARGVIPQSVKYRAMFNELKWGVHITDEFKAGHRPIASWLAGKCSDHLHTSKWVSLSHADYVKWLGTKELAKTCSMISDLESWSAFVVRMQKIDTVCSTTYVDQV